ncbi:branched-chain amino acid aminotransferase [Fusarium albosuccineum]|uniref:Branched-chain-amino-acid aminotransferase n=1 Tax=Fusarium albosuccineum TaxID=1237068 RepID=A0A8H4PFD8_9HYPO|nr:branched-chain amino acid aminotransferase [Fusarium albosuccineum]
MPSANVLQYATACFEGIKAYRGYDGNLRLFRVSLNCARMLKSSTRVGLPSFDPAALEQLIHSFVALEAERWLPRDRKGETLYLRPTHIGTTPGLGLQKPRQSSLYVIATLSPGFSTSGGMTLVTSPAESFRAWPGGFGNAKLGANYGPTLAVHADAVARGFDQVLWLFGSEQYATEAGVSNFFVIWKTRQGDLELVTAGLENKTILGGITRRSIIELVQARQGNSRSWMVDGTTLEPLRVVERDFSINEVRDAIGEGRLLEAFASGTAVGTLGLCHDQERR